MSKDRLPSPDDLRRLYGPAPAPVADRRIGPKPSRADLERRYCRQGQSVRDIAAALGCSKDMIHRALKSYGIEARGNAKRSRLQDIPLREIRAAIAAQGLRGAARAYGVDHSTLAQHLKVRRE